ncbi:hypothetical protein D4R78_04090 [bacterium]|nr:MAG: hypothetical protein D4R78_04090 [bacterium]
MEKKESPKIESSSPLKIAGFSSRIFSIIKFILGVCLLSFVYSYSAALIDELSLVDKSLQTDFWAGVVTLLIVYLFIWEPALIYTKGQKLVEIVFSFFRPLVRVAPYLIPIYTLVLFFLYGIVYFIVKSESLTHYFVFLIGFSISLHLIFSAKSIRSKQGDFLKANYIFGFSLIYILNLILLAFGFNLIFKDFSFVNFFNSSYQFAKAIYYAVFKQLFL